MQKTHWNPMNTWMFSASTGAGFLPSPVDPKNKQTQTRMSKECQLALVCVHEEYNDIRWYKWNLIANGHLRVLEILDSSCHKPEPIQISLEINDFRRKSIDPHPNHSSLPMHLNVLQFYRQIWHHSGRLSPNGETAIEATGGIACQIPQGIPL